MASAKFLLICSLMAIVLREIHGHGMMLEPVSRSSAWREGFDVPPNHNDNQLFCGGLKAQYEENGGKCGLCGDNYALPQPRPNENGGTYGTGVIVKKYSQGQLMHVNVSLSMNHLGTFSFAVCPLEHQKDLESEECFDKHPVKLSDGSSELEVLDKQLRFDVVVRLPEDVTCEHCVFRWTYHGGNHAGTCKDGSTAMGCGPQVTFRNCADVSILP